MKKVIQVLSLLCLMVPISTWAQEVEVDIKAFMYGPRELKIAPGTKVTWVNDDQVPHTVAETHKVFRSGALDTNERFSYVFDTPGVYEYFCALHPQMIGKITVSAN
ncbi:cupredoxin domain-containing protein [Pseudomonas akapageensis]|uniref:cupredoxin domain-containing protein n=1 Tax=Pseudomonas akapageensis TaxID=2609961 RepID=UPI00140A838E|nr:cupredoxin family copper-binding protein [Pseudomonas akapageensis]